MLLKHLIVSSQDAQASSSVLQLVHTHIQSKVKAYILSGCDRSPGVEAKPVKIHSSDEKFTPVSNHNKSLPRQQPRATHQMKSLQPCDSPFTMFSSSVLALIMMTGTTASGTVFRSSTQNSWPDISGIMQSSKIRSGRTGLSSTHFSASLASSSE